MRRQAKLGQPNERSRNRDPARERVSRAGHRELSRHGQAAQMVQAQAGLGGHHPIDPAPVRPLALHGRGSETQLRHRRGRVALARSDRDGDGQSAPDQSGRGGIGNFRADRPHSGRCERSGGAGPGAGRHQHRRDSGPDRPEPRQPQRRARPDRAGTGDVVGRQRPARTPARGRAPVGRARSFRCGTGAGDRRCQARPGGGGLGPRQRICCGSAAFDRADPVAARRDPRAGFGRGARPPGRAGPDGRRQLQHADPVRDRRESRDHAVAGQSGRGRCRPGRRGPACGLHGRCLSGAALPRAGRKSRSRLQHGRPDPAAAKRAAGAVGRQLRGAIDGGQSARSASARHDRDRHDRDAEHRQPPARPQRRAALRARERGRRRRHLRQSEYRAQSGNRSRHRDR